MTISTYQQQYDGCDIQRTVTYDYSADLVLRYRSMQHQAERHQDPWQVWRGEHQQSQEAQPRLRVPPRPDIDQATAQGRTQERHRQHRRQAQEYGSCI